MPRLHTVLRARINLTRIRNSVESINKVIQVKALEIKGCIQNQEVIDVQDNVNCIVYQEIKTTQTRPDTAVSNARDCFRDIHQKPKQCPAMKSKCHRCQKIGHWAGMYRLRIIFGDYNKLQTTIEDTDGSVSNVDQKNHTIEENHKVTQSDQQKLNLVDELNGLTEAKINSSSLWDTNCVIV